MNAAVIERIHAEPAVPIDEGEHALRVVTTRGRRSGEPRALPLGVLRHDGRLYLVSPDAGRDWVRNLRADPSCEVAGGGARARIRFIHGRAAWISKPRAKAARSTSPRISSSTRAGRAGARLIVVT